MRAMTLSFVKRCLIHIEGVGRNEVANKKRPPKADRLYGSQANREPFAPLL